MVQECECLIFQPHRVLIKTAVYFFNRCVTIPTLVEIYGETISKPKVVFIKEELILSDSIVNSMI